MKKLILLLLLLLLCASAFAQTTTFTGTIKDLTGTAVTSGQVTFTLQPGIDTTISGNARFSPSTVTCSITAAGAVKALDGVSSCVVANNTALTPSNTSYKICIQPGFVSPGSCLVTYALGGSVDITTLSPTQTQVPAYSLVDLISNQTIGGNKTATGNWAFSGLFSVAGAASLPNINGILTVDGTKYTTIDAAYADCPSTGCIIRVKAGTLPCPVIAITKPVNLVGAGPGGFATANDNSYSSGTTLINGSTTASCITIGGSLTTAQALNGVVIESLSIQGNKNVGGATSGHGIAVVGGDSTTQLTNSIIRNVFIHDAKGSGIAVQENIFGLNIEDTQITKNGGDGISVTNSGTGAPSQIRLTHVFDWLNTGDGLKMSGTNVHDVSATQSTFANNTNGVEVVAGSTIATFIATDSSNFEQNTNAGVLLSDGFGHAIRDSQFPADGTQLFGVSTNFPVGGPTTGTQLTLSNNKWFSNLTNDISIGANEKTGYIQPQATSFTISDASGKVVKEAVNNGGAKVITATEYAPASNGSIQLGDAAAAWSNVFTFDLSMTELTSPGGTAGKDVCYGDSTAHALECSYNNGSFFKQTQTIGSGTSTSNGTAVAAGVTQAQPAITVTGATTSDTATCNLNAAPPATWQTGIVLSWNVTANTVTPELTNGTAGSITPAATAVRCTVTR